MTQDALLGRDEPWSRDGLLVRLREVRERYLKNRDTQAKHRLAGILEPV